PFLCRFQSFRTTPHSTSVPDVDLQHSKYIAFSNVSLLVVTFPDICSASIPVSKSTQHIFDICLITWQHPVIFFCLSILGNVL
uniref:Uncharacterized protein n=1 Tax=Myripristis murdjan TaxID=586833 RepID=A0A667XB28_9TELE